MEMSLLFLVFKNIRRLVEVKVRYELLTQIVCFGLMHQEHRSVIGRRI